MQNQQLTTPPRRNYIKEFRALGDLALMPGYLLAAEIAKGGQVDKTTPVLLIPGIGGGDRVMAPFKRYLKTAGYNCYGWNMGVNLAGLNLEFDKSELTWDIDPSLENNGELGVPYLCDKMVERTKQISEETGSPVAIIGWSLGGCIAREVARDIPDLVKCVVTLGTPVQGGPKYTSASTRLSKKGLDMDWIEQEVKKRDQNPITRPITAIVSKSDGVVGYAATIDRVSTNVEHIDANISHMGMVFNKQAWKITREVLDACD